MKRKLSSTLQLSFKKNIDETFMIEPADWGVSIITDWHHFFTKPLKRYPFIIIIPLSTVVVVTLFIVFSTLVIRLASLLQYGF